MNTNRLTLDLSHRFNLGDPVVLDGSIYYVLGMHPTREYSVIGYNYILGQCKSLDTSLPVMDRVDDRKTRTAAEHSLRPLAAVWKEQHEKLSKELADVQTDLEKKKRDLAELSKLMG